MMAVCAGGRSTERRGPGDGVGEDGGRGLWGAGEDGRGRRPVLEGRGRPWAPGEEGLRLWSGGKGRFRSMDRGRDVLVAEGCSCPVGPDGRRFGSVERDAGRSRSVSNGLRPSLTVCEDGYAAGSASADVRLVPFGNLGSGVLASAARGSGPASPLQGGAGMSRAGRSSAAEGGVGWCKGRFLCALCASGVFGAGCGAPEGQGWSGGTARPGVPPLR